MREVLRIWQLCLLHHLQSWWFQRSFCTLWLSFGSSFISVDFLTSMSNMGQVWEKMGHIRLGDIKHSQHSRADPLCQIQFWELSSRLFVPVWAVSAASHSCIVRSSRTNALIWKNFPVCQRHKLCSEVLRKFGCTSFWFSFPVHLGCSCYWDLHM